MPKQYEKKLKAAYVGTRKSKSGFESVVTYYECEDCVGCPHKKSYTRSKGNRKMQVSKHFVEQHMVKIGVLVCFAYGAIFGCFLSYQWFSFGTSNDYTGGACGNNFYSIGGGQNE